MTGAVAAIVVSALEARQASLLAELAHPQAWHDERRGGIGGSDARHIMAGHWSALWEEKTGRRQHEDTSRNLMAMIGRFTEPFHRAWFARETGLAVSLLGCDSLRHSTHRFMRGNIDGRVPGGILECKNVAGWAKDEEVVAKYYWQVQHYLALTGAPLCHLSLIFGNHKWAVFQVARDEDAIADLVNNEAEFWCHVETDTPPVDRKAAPVDISFDDMREADMTGSNAWASGAADWLANAGAARVFKAAEAGIKELVAADVRRAHGHGIEATRARNGSLRIKEMKT